MNIEIIEQKIIPLTDEEILFYNNLKNPDKSLFNDVIKLSGAGIILGLGGLCLTKTKAINRRNFMKMTLTGTTTAGLILTQPDESEAFWPLIYVVVGAAVALGSFMLGAAIASSSRSRSPYDVGYANYNNNSNDNAYWKKSEGGKVKFSTVNPSDRKKSGLILGNLKDSETGNLEHEEKIGIDNPPFSKQNFKLKVERLPYTGIKKIGIKSALNEKITKNIHVL